MTKGFDFEEAIALSVLLAALLANRKHFFREWRLFPSPLNLSWMLAISMAIGLIIWVISLAYRHIEYQHELWWSFAWHHDAPRSMRSLIGASIVVAPPLDSGVLPRSQRPELGNAQEFAEVSRIVAQTASTSAQLALLGDRRFIFSHDRLAVVMFG
ncbi:MAG: hypothetical protein KF752_19670 [Pirellulaceae bacterium]|nr:hypothetical protein [Pirellulaceae bacterium]